jgi:hypothetical protein
MKKGLHFLYLCFYCAVVVRGLRHYRANMAMSVSITMYTINFFVFVYVYLELYNVINSLLFVVLLALLGLTSGFVAQRYFERRLVYGEVTAAYKDTPRYMQRIYGIFGVVVLLGSFVGLIGLYLLVNWLRSSVL